MLSDADEDSSVRAACVNALEQWSQAQNDLSPVRIALREQSDAVIALRGAMSLSRLLPRLCAPCDEALTKQAEEILMSEDAPCQHLLAALRRLVDYRENRKLGVSREARIARALSSEKPNIRVAFVFGSSAKEEQGPDSDVDLMVIGDTTLERLSPGIRDLEQELGRQVNLVTYAPAEWRTRLQEGHSFIREVMNSRKRFVLGGEDELGAVG